MLYVYRSAYQGQGHQAYQADQAYQSYQAKWRYWRQYRLLRRTLEYAITAAAAVLASYLILQVRW